MLLVVSTFLLGACALPVPVQVASWALDGVSLITTHKSVADHGLSLIANEDCAMWRAVEGDNICSGNYAGLTVVATTDANTGNTDELANFETAAGPAGAERKDNSPVFESPALPALDKPISPEYSPEQDPSEFADAWTYILGSSPPPDMPEMSGTADAGGHTPHTPPHLITASVAATKTGNRMVEADDKAKITAWFPMGMTTKTSGTISRIKAKTIAKVIKPSEKSPYAVASTVYRPKIKARQPALWTAGKSSGTEDAKVGTGLYFVIGSFSKRDRAFVMAAKHRVLKPKIAISRMDGGEINRVIVGPFSPGDKKAIHHLVRNDGIFDAWAARINPAKWSLLDPLESSDLAQLQQ